MVKLNLLLDEHYPPELARQLLEAGIDATTVIERDDLRGQSDTAVLFAAKREGRVVVTEDVTTFPVAMEAVPDHSGVVFCDSVRFPRTVSALPRLIAALKILSVQPPEAAAHPGFVWWLQEATA